MGDDGGLGVGEGRVQSANDIAVIGKYKILQKKSKNKNEILQI